MAGEASPRALRSAIAPLRPIERALALPVARPRSIRPQFRTAGQLSLHPRSTTGRRPANTAQRRAPIASVQGKPAPLPHALRTSSAQQAGQHLGQRGDGNPLDLAQLTSSDGGPVGPAGEFCARSPAAAGLHAPCKPAHELPGRPCALEARQSCFEAPGAAPSTRCSPLLRAGPGGARPAGQ